MMSLPRSIFIPLFLGFSLLVSLPFPATSLTCTSQKFTGKKVYSNCVDLPVLNSFLHWTLDSSNSSLSIAFVAPAKPGGWVSWAINPTGTGMAGAQALVAFKDEKGVVTAKTYNISSYSSVVPGKLSFDVWDLMAEELSGGEMSIFAKVKLPENADKVNQVWQVGPSVTDDGKIEAHEFAPTNMDSKGVLNLKSGQSLSSGGDDSRTQQKNIHGVLNAVSWGFLFPVGVIIARYMRVFPSLDPAWFYLHVFCQVAGYAIGVSGWAIGLKLGNESQGIQHTGHRNIGIAVFCLATLQVLALVFRPKKDHRYRFWWNMYHRSVGYTTIILGIINIFGGFNILSPQRTWKVAYVAALGALAVIALLLEFFTWIVFCMRKSQGNATINIITFPSH